MYPTQLDAKILKAEDRGAVIVHTAKRHVQGAVSTVTGSAKIAAAFVRGAFNALRT